MAKYTYLPTYLPIYLPTYLPIDMKDSSTVHRFGDNVQLFTMLQPQFKLVTKSI